jgi:glutamine amidotransferase
MCRHLGYVGPPITLAEAVRDLDHSLLKQSYQARELLTGSVCADGYGIGWYAPENTPAAGRYAFPGPIWSDGNLDTMGEAVRSSTIVAAVRNATIAGQNNEPNCAPFANGRHLFSLNGYFQDFDTGWRETMPAGASRGNTDGEWLFMAILAALDDNVAPAALATTVQETCRLLLARGQELQRTVQINLIISDGGQVIATRAGSGSPQNSLYVLQDGEEFPDGTLLASEPTYDDPLWQKIDENSLIVARAGAPLVRMKI